MKLAAYFFNRKYWDVTDNLLKGKDEKHEK